MTDRQRHGGEPPHGTDGIVQRIGYLETLIFELREKERARAEREDAPDTATPETPPDRGAVFTPWLVAAVAVVWIALAVHLAIAASDARDASAGSKASARESASSSARSEASARESASSSARSEASARESASSSARSEDSAREAASASARSETLAQEAVWRARIIQDCGNCPEMVVVPPGNFRMGSLISEADRRADEWPVHRVTIEAPFAVGIYEVTFDEWSACVSAGGCGGYRPSDRGGRQPIVLVSWNEAQSYVEWLSDVTGENYRLLSEAEWEYVARAGTGTRYWWGDEIGWNRASCDGCRSRWDDDRMAPVGSFGANAFGLHDVHGNVWEWTQDCRNMDYHGAPGDGSARESDECSMRIARGGSSKSDPVRLRAASRLGVNATTRFSDLGFRVARRFSP